MSRKAAQELEQNDLSSAEGVERSTEHDPVLESAGLGPGLD